MLFGGRGRGDSALEREILARRGLAHRSKGFVYLGSLLKALAIALATCFSWFLLDVMLSM